MKRLQRELANAAAEKSPEKRGVRVAVVVAKALRPLGEDPVLVGGSAVAFYTAARYTTQDIDMIVFGGPDVVTAMTALGFRRQGKDYIHEKLKLYVEFPSATLQPGERAIVLKVGEDELKIISAEDLIVDRLNHYKFFRSTIDALNVMMLLELPDLNRFEIEQKAGVADSLDALDYIEKVQQRVIRERLKEEEATQLLEAFVAKN